MASNYWINRQHFKDWLGEKITRTEATKNSIDKDINHENDKSKLLLINVKLRLREMVLP